MIYNGPTGHYVTNIQGNIVVLLSTTGEVVVDYTYDAWDNILTIIGSMKDTLRAITPHS